MELLRVFQMQLFLLPLLITSSFLPDNCPAKCGDISVQYPFGIGDGCFRPGFELTCNNSTDPPTLFIANQTTYQITDDITTDYNTFYAISSITIMPSNVNNYTVTVTLPINGPYFLDEINSLVVIGCGIVANLTDMNGIVGQCTTFCDSEEALATAEGSSCRSIGCCQISLLRSLKSYMLQLTRVEEFNSLNQDYDVKAFMTLEEMYTFMQDDVYISTTTRFDSNIIMHWSIPYPLTCEAAQEQNDSYACLDKNSHCMDDSDTTLGYFCECPSYPDADDDNRYRVPDRPVGNPYIPGGCKVVPFENITQPHLECQKKCGKIDIPFPFGLAPGCYHNHNFALICNATAKSDPTLVFKYRPDRYQVDEILIEEGLIRVDTTNETMEDRFGDDKPFFYYNESGLFNWAIDYVACDQAKNRTNYLCISEHSYCVSRNLTRSQVGYHCSCGQGYEGNPYLAQGCQDINECLMPEKYCLNGSCQNFDGGYICCHSGTSVNPTSKSCVTQHKPRNMAVGHYIGLGFGIGLICLLITVGLIFGRRELHKRIQNKLRKKYFHQNHGLLLQQLISCDEDSAEKTKIFTLKELEKATTNFDESRIVGQGGHGTVFKGLLSDQRVVAIKKSKSTKKMEIDQFINEVVILSRINHRNIVKIFGCCLEAEVPLLVYEFISNGTLHNHLHASNFKSTLSWEDRLRIASETAGALSYMHSAASISIFHRDVKSANILLDDYLTAKVSDFGASRLIPIDQTQVATAVQGTLGYLDPEYHYTCQLTEKSDVYSFGVILVELLTGELPISSSRAEEET